MISVTSKNCTINTLTWLHVVGTMYIETEQAETVREVLFLNISKLLS